MCGIWDALRRRKLSIQETRPLLSTNRTVPLSSTMSSNQETRLPLTPNRTMSSNQETRRPLTPNHTKPQTFPSNKTALPSPTYTSIRSSPMSGLSDLELEVVPRIFQCLFDLITKHLCRLQAMHDSRDSGERTAASKLLRRAVSTFSWATNRRLTKKVVFESLLNESKTNICPGLRQFSTRVSITKL